MSIFHAHMSLLIINLFKYFIYLPQNWPFGMSKLEIMSGQVRSSKAGAGQVRSDQVMSGQVSKCEVRSGQVESGQVRLGQFRYG